jgi:ABC-type uncharacterized transport system substrate-binding protein
VLHEIKPQMKTLGLVLNAPDPFHVPLQREIANVARSENIELVPALITPGELEQTIEGMADRGVDGVQIQPSIGLQAAAALALKYRLPAISFRRELPSRAGSCPMGRIRRR